MYPQANHSTTENKKAVLWVGTIPDPGSQTERGFWRWPVYSSIWWRDFLVGWFGRVLGITAAWHHSHSPPQRPCQSPVSTNRSDNSYSDNHEIISQYWWLMIKAGFPHTLHVHHGQSGATMEPELRGSSLLEIFMIVMEENKNKETASIKKKDASFSLTLLVTSHRATCKFNIC